MSKNRLRVMRAMYLVIIVGLVVTIWPGIIASSGEAADSHTVVSSFLAGLTLLSLIGVRYPVKMLPILLFEFVWKSFWLVVFALPMFIKQGLDQYSADIAVACAVGVILTPLAIPWGYVFRQYFGRSSKLGAVSSGVQVTN